MEYSELYTVGFVMHFRPYSQMYKRAEKLREQHSGLEIFVNNEKKVGDLITHEISLNSPNIMSLMHYQFGGIKGEQVRITVKGEYPLDKLKECAEILSEYVKVDGIE